MSLDTDLMPKTSREVWVLHGVNVYFGTVLRHGERLLNWLTTTPKGIGLRWDVEETMRDQHRVWRVFEYGINGSESTIRCFDTVEEAHVFLDDVLYEQAARELDLFDSRAEVMAFIKKSGYAGEEVGLVPVGLLNWHQVRGLPLECKLILYHLFAISDNINGIVNSDVLSLALGVQKQEVEDCLDELARRGLIVYNKVASEITIVDW